MRVGTITIYMLDNYGSVLQAYALKTALLKLGHKSEIIGYSITHTPSVLLRYFTTSLREQGMKTTLIAISSYIFDIISEKYGEIQRGDKNCKPSSEIFSDFRKQYLHITTQTYTPSSLKISPPEYDMYITGSDNVWSFTETLGISDGGARMYLDFVPEGKTKISYAASIGTPMVNSRHEERFKKLLGNIDIMSVRGKSAAQYISQLTGRFVVSVCDPTLLLSIDEWDALMDGEHSLKEEKYVLVYIIYPEPAESEAFQFAEYLAQIHSIPIKYIGYHFENGKPTYTNVSVSEFLETFKHASFIVTKTFHGVMFSIIFRRNFYAFKPKASPTRIVDILDEVGLPERLVTTTDEAHAIPIHIDYTLPNKNIESFRLHSLHWLENALRKPQ